MNDDLEPICYSVTDVNPKTVCMFTGFGDKHVKLIFEGDILEHIQSHVRFTVMFDRGAFFIRRNGTENTDMYLFELDIEDNAFSSYVMTLSQKWYKLGNIHFLPLQTEKRKIIAYE